MGVYRSIIIVFRLRVPIHWAACKLRLQVHASSKGAFKIRTDKPTESKPRTSVSSIERSDLSIAVVTPTFLPDLGRCELLAESMDRKVPDVPHYLIVDRRDRPAFSHLQSGRRRLIESEDILGNWIRRVPGRKGYWLSLKAPPVRGWILQQILKIGVIDAVAERTLVFCDSDTAFFRSFCREDLLVDGKIGLLDVAFANESSRRWTATARRLLGLPALDGVNRSHVGNMICWNREIIMAMRQQIEIGTGLNWQVALARTLSFSEYMIYGVFVREALGYDHVDHAPSTVPLVKPSWGFTLSTDTAIDAFFADFDPRTVAVMIHSKDGIDVSRYRHHLERRWGMTDKNGDRRVDDGSASLHSL
jgi:hypothetical protein